LIIEGTLEGTTAEDHRSSSARLDKEADAGEFASDEEVAALRAKKWANNAG
jgi:hypothetical protein